jgi:hypothetical protein
VEGGHDAGVVTATVSSARTSQGDIQLWVIALGMSLLINLLLAGALAFWVIDALSMSVVVPPEESVAEERVVTIMPEWTPVPDPAQVDMKKRFARTSPEQTAPEPPKTSAFEGERNTQATSNRTPMVDAPELPSQQGIEPRDPTEFETTESRFQDGRLDEPEAPVSVPTEPQPDFQPPAPEPVVAKPAQPAEPVAVPPQREKAFEGPNAVDVASQPDITPPKEKVEPTPPPEETPPEPQPQVTAKKEAPKEIPKPVTRSSDPAFSGFQQKTAIVGSISRTGQSALDVEDSPMGRYQAAISRAVELEWQRNCVRHRDFITPGFLTVRFFVEASGKVRSVQFAGDMETGEVQKGFTLNSIRDAPIPKMPEAVRKEQKGEPLELVFRFYF